MILDRQWSAQRLLDLVTTQGCRVHFGQFGEDCDLFDYFERMPHGFYVDVGCHHPTRFSNTFLLWKLLEWRGINIDADIAAVERMRAARPGDITLHCGVGATEGDQSFAVFGDGAINTFDQRMAAHQAQAFGPPRTVTVPVRTLADILGEHLPEGVTVDYLNVDCEGLDDAVLRSNDWARFRPKLLTVELHGLQLARAGEHRSVQLLHAVGYELISYYRVSALFRRLR